MREITRRLDDNLVVEDNLAENSSGVLTRSSSRPRRNLVDLHQLNPSRPDSKKSLYRRIPYTLRVAGTFEQTSGFLCARDRPRLANITTVDFRRVEPGGLAIVAEIDLELLGKK